MWHRASSEAIIIFGMVKNGVNFSADRGPVVQRYERPPCTREAEGPNPSRST